jgi:hypothetical protein
MGDLGLGAAGTAGDRAERDYHYGVTPQSLLGLRLIFGERAMLEARGRQYYVAGTSSNQETGADTSHFSQDVILRGSVGLTVRIYGPHALGIQYLVTSRNTGAPDLRDRHQSVQPSRSPTTSSATRASARWSGAPAPTEVAVKCYVSQPASCAGSRLGWSLG